MCTYHRIYDRSNYRGIWNSIHILSTFLCFRTHELRKVLPINYGYETFFERFILNPFSIFSMHVDCERPSNSLDLSHRSLFPEYRMLHQGLSWRTVWTTKFSLLKSRNVIPILICHLHI